MCQENKFEKLLHDLDAYAIWAGEQAPPPGGYDVETISGLRVNLMVYDEDSLYVVDILPGDDVGVYDAYVRRMEDGDMIHMFGLHAQRPEDIISIVMQNLPNYI